MEIVFSFERESEKDEERPRKRMVNTSERNMAIVEWRMGWCQSFISLILARCRNLQEYGRLKILVRVLNYNKFHPQAQAESNDSKRKDEAACCSLSVLRVCVLRACSACLCSCVSIIIFVQALLLAPYLNSVRLEQLVAIPIYYQIRCVADGWLNQQKKKQQLE